MKTCPSCGFHNTNERARCLKCSALLEHDWGVAQKRVRLRLIPFHRLSSAVANRYHAVRRYFTFPLPPECPYRHPWMAGFVALLPGLGQIYNRQYRKAVWFFLVFVAAIWLAVITVLNPFSYVFIGALIGWLLFSFNDAMVTATRIDGQEWTYGYTLASFSALFFYLGVLLSLSQFFLVAMFAGLVLYCLYSVFWAEGEINRAKILTTAIVAFGILILACVLARSGNPVVHRWVFWDQNVVAPTLQKGDYLYVDCLTYWFRKPRLGEVVYYNPRAYKISSGLDEYIVHISHAMERVVALPGDHLVRDGDKFYRNGQPVPPQFLPLNTKDLPGRFQLDVPPGHYLVFISYGPEEKILGGLGGTFRAPSPREGGSADWGSACMVAPREILGRAIFIWHPVAHRCWLTPPKSDPNQR